MHLLRGKFILLLIALYFQDEDVDVECMSDEGKHTGGSRVEHNYYSNTDPAPAALKPTSRSVPPPVRLNNVNRPARANGSVLHARSNNYVVPPPRHVHLEKHCSVTAYQNNCVVLSARVSLVEKHCSETSSAPQSPSSITYTSSGDYKSNNRRAISNLFSPPFSSKSNRRQKVSKAVAGGRVAKRRKNHHGYLPDGPIDETPEEAEKRRMHNVLERERREVLKVHYDTLWEVVQRFGYNAPRKGTKASKVAILDGARHHIAASERLLEKTMIAEKEQQNSCDQLKAQLRRLQRENAKAASFSRA